MMMMVFEFLEKQSFDLFSSFLDLGFGFRNYFFFNYFFWMLFFDIPYHIYALSFASLIGLHDKILLRQIGEIELIELFAAGDDTVGLCERDASLYEKIFRLELVVRQTDAFFVIELLDVEKISGVIAEDSEI